MTLREKRKDNSVDNRIEKEDWKNQNEEMMRKNNEKDKKEGRMRRKNESKRNYEEEDTEARIKVAVTLHLKQFAVLNLLYLTITIN